MAESLEHYLSLKYRIELREEDGVYVALHPELDGCASHGRTPDEAVTNLKEAREAWLEECLDAGLPIPEPGETRSSGRFLVRASRSLHRRLTEMAEREGVSFNQLVVQALSEFAGRAQARQTVEAAAESAAKLDVVLNVVEQVRDAVCHASTEADSMVWHAASGSASQRIQVYGSVMPSTMAPFTGSYFLASGEQYAGMLSDSDEQVADTTIRVGLAPQGKLLAFSAKRHA